MNNFRGVHTIYDMTSTDYPTSITMSLYNKEGLFGVTSHGRIKDEGKSLM